MMEFCWNSRVWLLFRAFQPPNQCVDPDLCISRACGGCSYLEDRKPTAYAQQKLKRMKEVFSDD